MKLDWMLEFWIGAYSTQADHVRIDSFQSLRQVQTGSDYIHHNSVRLVNADGHKVCVGVLVYCGATICCVYDDSYYLFIHVVAIVISKCAIECCWAHQAFTRCLCCSYAITQHVRTLCAWCSLFSAHAINACVHLNFIQYTFIVTSISVFFVSTSNNSSHTSACTHTHYN